MIHDFTAILSDIAVAAVYLAGLISVIFIGGGWISSWKTRKKLRKNGGSFEHGGASMVGREPADKSNVMNEQYEYISDDTDENIPEDIEYTVSMAEEILGS